MTNVQPRKRQHKKSQNKWRSQLLSLLGLFAIGLFSVIYSLPTPAQVFNPFNVRYQTNDTGDIRFVSNTIMTCPLLDITISRTDLTLPANQLRAGDQIRYTIVVTNNSSATANNVTLRNPIPANTTYSPGTLNITLGANSTPPTKTDAVDIDQAEFSGGQVTFRLGLGNSLGSGQSTTVTFTVRVNAGTPNATNIVNAATVSYDADSITFSPSATRTVTVGNNSTSGTPASISLNCSAAQVGTGTTTNGQNNDFNMVYVDVDGDPTTFNSSTAALDLLPGSTVLFAGLYWVGESSSLARNQVRFATPASGIYSTISATVLYTNAGNVYQGFANVTPLVQAGGNGTYGVANLHSTTASTNRYGGWSLVVVYRAPGEPPRNLTVFDGFASVNGTGANSTINIPVSGFITPPVGAVNVKLGAIAYDGDNGFGDAADGFTGDAFQLNGTAITNAVNPANDVFNSSISFWGHG